MFLFKSYFTTYLGFQFYFGLFVNYKMVKYGFVRLLMYDARLSFLFHFYWRKKLSNHNSSTKIQQKAQTCLEIQVSVMCRNLCNKQDVIKKKFMLG